MNRTEIMEKLTQATAQMDDAALEALANWAETVATIRSTGYDQIRETIVKNEKELAEHRLQQRKDRLRNLTLAEKRIWNKVQRGRLKARENSRADLTMNEADLLCELSAGGPQLAVDAFYLGFEKGYTVAIK